MNKGIIIKKIPYGEADEIITMLLADVGVVRFFVAGSRKSKKRYQGLIDQFAHLSVDYKESQRGLWRLGGCELIETQSRRVWSDVGHFAFGNYLAELIAEFIPEHSGDHGLYLLWSNITAQLASEPLTKDVASEYLKAFFSLAGYGVENISASGASLEQLVNFSHHVLQKRSQSAAFFFANDGMRHHSEKRGSLWQIS